MLNTATGLLIPFLGTVLGSAMVFFMRKEINKKLEKLIAWFCCRSDDFRFYLVTS